MKHPGPHAEHMLSDLKMANHMLVFVACIGIDDVGDVHISPVWMQGVSAWID